MSPPRVSLGVVAAGGLLAVFLFQHVDPARMLGISDYYWNFVFNRSVRFFVNDLLAIVLIFALFGERRYVVFAIWVQVAGMILILLPYFLIKYYYPRYNGPLISFLHRLVLNPTLILLLIPAFYYQRGQRR